MIDLVGLAGSALVVGSLTVESLYRLRVMGLAGAAAYVAYGLLLGAWPVVATNLVTLGIHVVRLRTLVVENGRDRPSAAECHGP